VDREGWLPLVRYGDMIPEFDLTLKVPARYTTLCVGRKVSETKTGDVSVTRWVAENPVVFPTAIYGIYMTDASEVKAKKTDGASIPVTVHFDKENAGLIAPKARRAAADQAANALNLYRQLFGVDYPYSKLDLVNAPEGLSGQSPSSIVYLGNESFVSEGVLGTEGGGEVTRFADSLVAHEVAHQWWGSLIAPANSGNYWWVESLAEYSSALYLEAAHGKASYQALVNDWRHAAIDSESWDTVQDGEGIYDKGAFVFHMMRMTFGDEAFFKFLKMLAGELKGREIVTRDIQTVAEEAFATGAGGMDWFFDQWVRGVGLPELTFTYRIAAAEGGAQVLEGRVDQRIMVTTKAPARETLTGLTFKALGAVTLTGKSGQEYTKRVTLEGPSVSFKVPLPEKPKSIVFNKHGEILAYDVIMKEEK
jgi:aminopeptidase N